MKIVRALYSRIDYPGYSAKVLFTPGCNFSCSACYAKEIVESKESYDGEKALEDVRRAKGWINAIVISGGEPTLQPDLLDFLGLARKIDLNFRREKLKIKLDTNGFNPDVLARLFRQKLIDYVALDVKGPGYLYSKLTGNKSLEDDLELGRIRDSLRFLSSIPIENYEFRTTLVPVIRNSSEISWMSIEEAEKMAEWVYQFNEGKAKWYVQPFVARTREEMMDERFSKEFLPKEFQETPKEKLEEAREIISSCGFDARLR